MHLEFFEYKFISYIWLTQEKEIGKDKYIDKYLISTMLKF